MVESIMQKKHIFTNIVLSVAFILLLMLSSGGCGSNNGILERIPAATLESAGFEYLQPLQFDLLLGIDSVYVMNSKDRIVVRFKGDKPVASYTYPEGKNRRLRFALKSIFFYDSETIGIYDYGKSFVRLLSLDLEFIREVPVKTTFSEVTVTQKGLTAFLFRGQDVFAFLDKDFNVTKSFCPTEKDLPFEGYYPRLLNQGFFLSPTLAAHTRWAQHEKECNVNVYDLESLERVLTLTWEKKTQWTAEEFEKNLNFYFTIFAAKIGPYYVVQNVFQKGFGMKKRYLLLVFDEKTKIIYDREFPYQLIRFQKPFGETGTRVYYMDDQGDIVRDDIRSIMERK